jgi:hypothetical protein
VDGTDPQALAPLAFSRPFSLPASGCSSLMRRWQYQANFA